MPCKKCDSGKWKFGRTGKCEYNSKSECETANADYYAEETVHEFTFTEDQMKELHENGEVIIEIEKDGEEMKLHFKYPQNNLMDLVNKSQKLTNKYRNKYGD